MTGSQLLGAVQPKNLTSAEDKAEDIVSGLSPTAEYLEELRVRSTTRHTQLFCRVT